MKITQIYEIMNAVADEILGEHDIIKEDLTNIVDMGQNFLGMGTDNYVKTLVDKVGKVVFADRGYIGSAPSVFMDSWEFGAIKQKITVSQLPDVVANSSWSLTDGMSYDPNIFHAPQVQSKFFSNMVTFEVDMSFTEKQLKSSFNSVDELNGFISMIGTSIENAFTIRINQLIMETIDNAIMQTMVREWAGTGVYFDVSTPEKAKASIAKFAGNNSLNQAVNLLKLYNDTYSKTLKKDKCMYDKDFLRYASYTMGMWIDYMKDISVLYNSGGLPRFTPPESLHFVLLSQFARASETFMESEVYHNELIKLPNGYETIQKWQGTGASHAFESVSKIHIQAPMITDVKINGENGSINGFDFEFDGVIGVMFDREALGVSNMDRRVTTQYNPKGEFYNNFYKFEAGYFNDLNENFVVFYVADPVPIV